MNKPFLMGIAITLSSALLFANGVAETQSTTDSDTSKSIIVYANDSFCGDWGPGPKLVKDFEAKTGISVELVSAGTTGEMISRLEIEKNDPQADLVVGISDDMAPKAYAADLFMPYQSPTLASIDPSLQFDPENRLLPFDYGNYGFVYDSEKLSADQLPKSLQDLTKPQYKDKVILIDPRTSSTGVGLLIWTIEEFGEDGYLTWWKAMKDNALTIAGSWSSAYGAFTEGEAPMVLSYTTSPVYHVMNEDTTRYQTLIFDEGHATTIEGIGLTKTCTDIESSEAFIEFVLNDAQADIAIANSMYPVNSNTALPDAYKWAPKPKKLTIDEDLVSTKLDKWLDDWANTMTE